MRTRLDEEFDQEFGGNPPNDPKLVTTWEDIYRKKCDELSAEIERLRALMVGAAQVAEDDKREIARLRALVLEMVEYNQHAIMPRDLRDWHNRACAAISLKDRQ